METLLKYFLPGYLLATLVLIFALPTYRVWKATGLNPYKLGPSDSAHDYVGRNFRLILIALVLVVIIFSFLPAAYPFLLPIPYLTNDFLPLIGQIILVSALIWVLIAQIHMQKSWRIGIDEDVKTDLVQTGLFSISRNPIFLGMRFMLLGIFLSIPNALTLTILVSGELLTQTQVRLEEEFLERVHGLAYADYRKKVRRWI